MWLHRTPSACRLAPDAKAPPSNRWIASVRGPQWGAPVARTVEELGLTEEATAESGGGFVHILILLAVLALASCKGCAHTQGSTRQQ